MNLFALFLPALLLYVIAHRYYSPFLARVFGVDDARVTPAVRLDDGVDFVPTRPHVLFAHHFSAIAAAGPILGPTMGVLYGYAPAFVWIVIGAILMGAVHDYVCLFVSVREEGRSMAEIARKYMGTTAFLLFALYIICNLILINAVFINLTAVSLTSLRSLADLGLAADQTLFRTVLRADGAPMAVVGGIASMSAIALTVVAPVLGFFVIRRNVPNRIAYPLATALCIGSVLIGFAYPVALQPLHLGSWVIDPTSLWIILIAVYVCIAAATPVWMILQPREFVSVQFLYLGIGVLLVALLSAGLQGVPIQAPAADIAQGEQILGWVWPSLFVTIACGAVSGFHSLVATGTTSKQLMRESHGRHIGYLAMLGESGLALCVTLAIAVGISYTDYTAFLIRPDGAGLDWKANPVLAFSAAVAGICHTGLSIPPWLGLVFGLLMVEGFVLDTLDVSIRLNRYLLEEVWTVLFRGRVPWLLKKFTVNAGIAVVLMLALAYGNTAQSLWPIFGSSNQLLAALSLLTAAIWLAHHGRRVRYVLVPAVLIGLTTLAALTYLLVMVYWPKGNHTLAGAAVLLILLAFGFTAMVIRAWNRHRQQGRSTTYATL